MATNENSYMQSQKPAIKPGQVATPPDRRGQEGGKMPGEMGGRSMSNAKPMKAEPSHQLGANVVGGGRPNGTGNNQLGSKVVGQFRSNGMMNNQLGSDVIK